MNQESQSLQWLSGTSVRIQPTPFFKRLIALIVDMGFVYFITYILMFVGGVILALLFGLMMAFIGGSNKSKGIFDLLSERFAHLSSGAIDLAFQGALGLIFIIFILLLFLLMLSALFATHGYFIYYELKHGATPGKRMFGLKVISLEGPKLTKKQCFIREFMRYVDAFLILPGIISVLLTEKKQRVGDLMASTMVVYLPKEGQKMHFDYMSQDAYYDFEAHLKQIKKIESFMRDDLIEAVHPYFIYPGGPVPMQTLNLWLDRMEPFFQIDARMPSSFAGEKKLRFFVQYCKIQSHQP